MYRSNKIVIPALQIERGGKFIEEKLDIVGIEDTDHEVTLVGEVEKDIEEKEKRRKIEQNSEKGIGIESGARRVSDPSNACLIIRVSKARASALTVGVSKSGCRPSCEHHTVATLPRVAHHFFAATKA
ncbi:hypothetical protein FQR65_LT17738 [Abscondita terminalis]|nr:hypothetical protein FQR65_LT17738 [Abscondita terminalis]